MNFEYLLTLSLGKSSKSMFAAVVSFSVLFLGMKSGSA